MEIKIKDIPFEKETEAFQQAYIGFFSRIGLSHIVTTYDTYNLKNGEVMTFRISGTIENRIPEGTRTEFSVQALLTDESCMHSFIVNGRMTLEEFVPLGERNYDVFRGKIQSLIVSDLSEYITRYMNQNKLWTIRFRLHDNPDENQKRLVNSFKKASAAWCIKDAEENSDIWMKTPFFSLIPAYEETLAIKISKSRKWIVEEK